MNENKFSYTLRPNYQGIALTAVGPDAFWNQPFGAKPRAKTTNSNTVPSKIQKEVGITRFSWTQITREPGTCPIAHTEPQDYILLKKSDSK